MGKEEPKSPSPLLNPISKCFCQNREGHETDIIPPCKSSNHWNYALLQICNSVFNTTSPAITSPLKHILTYERQLNRQDDSSIINKFRYVPNYKFNSEPFAVKDIFEYRQRRSEHLLLRLTHSLRNDEFHHSILRLTKGVFMVQQLEPLQSPTMMVRDEDYDDVFLTQSKQIPFIDTFSFNGLFNDMMQQAMTTSPVHIYKSISYTMGIRFTNPYKHMRDIVVRGNIPLWCQSLFIVEYLKRLPVQPNAVLNGLLPFAKDILFEFKLLSADQDVPFPILIPAYERYAMELSEPQILFNYNSFKSNDMQIGWKEREKRILNEVLYCDISDETAELITNLANEWKLTYEGLI
ncbi:uncharacterized protein BX663DRAFT_509134 [Cokeromyces recurvatus]|uniref:uncharacterized protein n=1 Tax=Cokeromyces recurvatus TaxID=90255 RepID=UPI00221FF1A2|nr:uncharacterized protein BX663DRAFT_509134 [Cokeromyces recurvatus]KAI7902994.1 hypothetical protein BX663DRAFT_509134 [Cokeromyces recurvatus]